METTRKAAPVPAQKPSQPSKPTTDTKTPTTPQWGSGEWPSAEFLKALGPSKQPPMNQQQYEKLLQRKELLEQQLEKVVDPNTATELLMELSKVVTGVLPTRRWLSENKPGRRRSEELLMGNVQSPLIQYHGARYRLIEAADYWGEEFREPLYIELGVGSGDPETGLPGSLDLPGVPEGVKTQLVQFYRDHLRQHAPNPKYFLWSVKRAVQAELARRWRQRFPHDRPDLTQQRTIQNLGDDFAHDLWFDFLGGDPEFNFLDNPENKALLDELYSADDHDLANQLIQIAQEAALPEGNMLRKGLADARNDAEQSTQEHLEDIWLKPTHELGRYLDQYLRSSPRHTSPTLETLSLAVQQDPQMFDLYQELVEQFGEDAMIQWGNDFLHPQNPNQQELRFSRVLRPHRPTQP